MTCTAALLTAASASAAASTEPGNLILKPASGAATLMPTWSTTDGCPSGHQGSAVLGEFSSGGKLLSRISITVSDVASAFSGELDGNIGAILHLTGVQNGATVTFAVGCWSLEAGTGSVQYVQSTSVTLSSDGKTYKTSSSGAQLPSSAGQPSGPGSVNYAGGPAPAASGGTGSQALAAWLAGAGGLVLATGGVVWYRRRQDRSRLM